MELSGESMEWWKPLSLDNRQYANKVIFSSPSTLGGSMGTFEEKTDLLAVIFYPEQIV